MQRDLCLDVLGLEETWVPPGAGKLIDRLPATVKAEIEKRKDAATIWGALQDAELGHARVAFADHRIGADRVRTRLARLAGVRDASTQTPAKAPTEDLDFDPNPPAKLSLRARFEGLPTPLRLLALELGVQGIWLTLTAAATFFHALHVPLADAVEMAAIDMYARKFYWWLLFSSYPLIHMMTTNWPSPETYVPTEAPRVDAPARSLARDMRSDVTPSFQSPRILVWSGSLPKVGNSPESRERPFELVSLLFRDRSGEVQWMLVVREKP